MMASTPTPPVAPVEDSRGCIAEISLSAIRKNFDVVQRRSGGRPSVCTVKANAYGHGAPEVARTLQEAGAHGFGVVTLEEAAQLRAAGITGPILLVGGASWWSAPERVLTLGAIPLVASAEEINALDAIGRAQNRVVDIHVAIDTGLSREGFYVGTSATLDLSAIVDALKLAPFVRAVGAMTHFVNADLANETQSVDQVGLFSAAVGGLRARGIAIEVAHFSNSAASLRKMELDKNLANDITLWTRPGICLYGITPYPDGRLRDELVPAMSWRAPVVARKRVPPNTTVSYGGTFVTTRETEIAVLGVGYADGFPRHLSNRGEVVFGDLRAPVLGRVCMDLTVVDVTDVVTTAGNQACGLGAFAWLLGGPSSNAIDAWEMGRAADTIGYEVVVRVGSRVPRRYHA